MQKQEAFTSMRSISAVLYSATRTTEQEASNVFFCGHPFSLSSERLGKLQVSGVFASSPVGAHELQAV